MSKIVISFPGVLIAFLLFSAGILFGQDTDAAAGTEKERFINLYSEPNDNGYDILAENRDIVEHTVVLEFRELINLNPDMKEPYIFVVPASSKGTKLLSLNRVRQGRSGFEYMFSESIGNTLNTKHDDNHLYLLPFEHGRKYKVTQGYNGKATHSGLAAYSLDFTMPVGTKIVAARKGLVVSVIEKYDSGGYDMGFEEFSNHLTIQHEDGTFALYAHLKKNGAILEKGDSAKAGQIIGYSGNTGLSSGPHLHFAVNVPAGNGYLQSIPVKFLNHDKTAVTPVNGRYYYSTHPGKPPFKAVFGRNLSLRQFEKYEKKISRSDTLFLKEEMIDETTVIYVTNGHNYKCDVTVSLFLDNLTCNRSDRFTVSVPPLTEKFILILKPVNPDQGWNIKYKYSYSYYE